MHRSGFLAFFLSFITILSAQKRILFTANNQVLDTFVFCPNVPIFFSAYVVDNNDTLLNYWFLWDFNDGNQEEGLNLNVLNHEYSKGGFYRIFIKAYDSNDTIIKIIPVKIGLKPVFSGTKSSVPEGKTICSGEEVELYPEVKPFNFKEKPNNLFLELYPALVNNNFSYLNIQIVRNYPENLAISSLNDIDCVGVKIEHSLSSAVQIRLICPTGKSVILKDFGGADLRLGNPNLANPFEPGQGLWYYFKNFSSNGFMNDYTGGAQIPSNTYQSQQSFSNLIGCPLNGEWKIVVNTVSAQQQNGFVWGWSLFFKKNCDTISFTNSYNISQSVWNGDGVNYTNNGVGYAVVSGVGNHVYSYLIKDDFGCWHDTSIYIQVSKPKIEIDKDKIFCGDSIHYSDKTDWSQNSIWAFGDGSANSTLADGYKKYVDTGTFKIILTAISQSGCRAYDTVKVFVSAKPIDIPKYNIFTPNNDGINDIFSFFNQGDEKLIPDNIEKIDGAIYDKNGVVVCKWTTPEEFKKGWDGSYFNNGKRFLPAGTYFYVLKIKGKNGVDYKPFFGTIYLYR